MDRIRQVLHPRQHSDFPIAQDLLTTITSMSDKAAAVSISLGRFRLVLGSDVGIAAMEVVASGDQTRLNLRDLPGAARRLQSPGGDSTPVDATFVVSALTDDATSLLTEDVVVDVHGADDSDLLTRIRALESGAAKCILAEAAFAAWRQRVADAADSLNELTRADAEIIGQLNIPGRPLLTEMRAERRRNLYVGNAHTFSGDGVAIDRVIVDLRAAVRFGAAGLAVASDDLIEDAVQAACAPGSWIDRLRLLLAAEEIRAIELLVAAGVSLSDAGPGDSGTVKQLLSETVSRREQAEQLATLLDEVAGRLLSAASGNLAKRFIKRKAQRAIAKVRETVEAYSSAVTGGSSHEGDTTTWDEAADSLYELDLVTGPDSDTDQRPSQSAEGAAAALGELFAENLPSARALVDDLARQHPGVEPEVMVQIVKRQAVHKLAQSARRDHDGPPVPETVAQLAMAIALLRGIEPRSESEFNALGLRILSRAERVAALHRQAGTAVPQAFAGFQRFAKYIQPIVVEFAFHKMAGVKPARPGAARDAYKFARSRVWRARHDQGVAGAAAGGASAAVMKAMDTAAPRVIVRYVERSLPAPRR